LDAENPLPMGNIFEHIGKQPFTIFNHSFLMAEGAKMPSFARIGRQIFMTTVIAADLGKAAMLITTL
jgi:hypothetical protein